MAEAKRDGNYVPTLLGVSSSDGVTPVTIYADPTTHRLYVDSTGSGSPLTTKGDIYTFSTIDVALPVGTNGQVLSADDSTATGLKWITAAGSGTVTDVSIVTANGISGTVATSTTTPAITLALGVIAPTSVNGLTLAAQAVGFTIAGGTTSKTLTVPLDASISGTNTGDNSANSNVGLVHTAGAESITGAKTFDKDTILMKGTSTGVTTVSTANTSGTSYTLTMPAITDTITTNTSTQTITNKTLNSNTNYIDADSTHQKVFLALGRAGVVGDAVYISAWNVANSCVEVSLARANSANTLPCAGLLESAGADGTVQSMRVEGVLSNVDTSAWSTGARLYVSAATAGLLTSTRPTTPNLDQAVATVAFQDATTGILDVIRTAYVGTMAYADTATYAPLTSPTFQTSINGAYLTASEVLITDASKNIVSAPVATYPSLTEFSYVKGVTSAIQTQLGAKLPLAGGTMTGNITLAESKQIVLTVPTTDGGCTGPSTSAFVSGYTSSAIGDLVYLDVNAKWQKVDADAVATTAGMLGIALAVAATDAALLAALPGSFVYSTAFPTLTVGGTCYAGETPGAIQQAIPTGADGTIREIGYAVHADKIYFMPTPTTQEVVA